MTANENRLTPDVGAHDHAQGRSDASVTLVEFGDYECPYCGRAYPLVKRLQTSLAEPLRFVFRNFPLAETHPNAMSAAEFAEAAALQGKFWEAHDYLFEHQQALTNTDLLAYTARLELDADEIQRVLRTGAPAQRVRADFASGLRSGVNGTPTFFINGVRFDGDWGSEAAFEDALMNAAADLPADGVSGARAHFLF